MKYALIVATGLSLIACLPGAHATETDNLQVFHHENVLGTSLELKVLTTSLEDAKRAESAALMEIDRLSNILSCYEASSEISRWLRTSQVPVKVSPELYEVLGLFDSWRTRSGGALDAAAESISRIWKSAATANHLPPPEAIAPAVTAIRQRHWTLDPAGHTATHLTDVPLVFNSLAKSYIAGHACEVAMKAGMIDAMIVNIGGDLVVRGDLTEFVRLANPKADAENDPPLATVHVYNQAVATSGNYRRGLSIGGKWYSHIVDPRTGQPAGHVLSATVVAANASDAGALATACCVLQPDESLRLVATVAGAQCLLLTQGGQRIVSKGWDLLETPLPGRSPTRDSSVLLSDGQPAMPADAAAAHPSAPTVAGSPRGADGAVWDENFELVVTMELSRFDGRRAARPFVAVWIEDPDKYAVRTLALWYYGKRWLADLKSWYHGEQLRALAEGSDIMQSVSSATRAPGRYTLKWDGRDNAGKLVKPGKYTVLIEAAREHGTYQIMRHELDFNGTAASATLKGNVEISSASLDYHRKSNEH